jgi:hypothetical protein
MNCMKARVDLLDHLYPRDTGDSAVWLAVSGCIEADDENFSPLITQQIIHVANCQSCQKCLDFIDPSRITARERAEKQAAHGIGGVHVEVVDGEASLTCTSPTALPCTGGTCSCSEVK